MNNKTPITQNTVELQETLKADVPADQIFGEGNNP